MSSQKCAKIEMMKKERKIEKDKISKIPKEPGVYFFYDKKGKLLYIGKAADLRSRVKSHFAQPDYRSNMFAGNTEKIGYIPLSSEVEALLTESQLIKKNQPKFNILFRDDKKYFYVGITREDWPVIFLTHQPKYKADFTGPFTDGASLKQTLKILRKIFPYRSCKSLPKRSCLWYDLNRCPAPCLIEKEKKVREKLKDQTQKHQKEYKKNIKKLKEVLLGKRKMVLKDLKKEMQKFSKEEEFEEAAKTRDKIEALEKVFSHKIILEKPELEEKKENEGKILKKALSISKIPRRIEGYDVSNIKANKMVGSMIVFKLDPESKKYLPDKKEYRLFRIKTVKKQNDIACLKEIVSRRFKHKEWKMPNLVYVDGGKAQFNVVNGIINKKRGKKIPVVSLAKKKQILYTNIFDPPISLDKLEKAAKMTILRLKDESHRFAISYHKKLRKKSILNLS
jgi:excinuclease ABC subunit C